MIRDYLCVFGVTALICMSASAQKSAHLDVRKYSDVKLSSAEVAKAEALLDQLVFASGDATN